MNAGKFSLIVLTVSGVASLMIMAIVNPKGDKLNQQTPSNPPAAIEPSYEEPSNPPPFSIAQCDDWLRMAESGQHQQLKLQFYAQLAIACYLREPRNSISL